jgi:fucose permease
VRALDGRAALLLAAFAVMQWSYAAVLARAPLPRLVVAHSAGGDNSAGLLRSRLLWLLAGLLLVYVGVEVGVGGWAYTYARDSAGISATAASLLSSGFWAALTAGRLCSPRILRRLSPAGLLIAGPALAAAAALGLVIGGHSPVVVVAGVLLAGFGCGPVWPVAFAIANRAFPAAAGSASGVLGMVSSAGGLVIPWLQGRVLAAGGPAAGISVTLAGSLMVAALASAVRRDSGPSPPSPA